MTRARNRWGWGFQDAVIGAAEARAAAPGVVELLGFGSTEVEEPQPIPALPAPRVAAPAALAHDLLGRGPRSRLPQPRQVLRRHHPRLPRALRARRRPRPAPARRARGRRRCSSGRPTRTSRWSPTAAARASSAASSRGSRAPSTAPCRSISARWTACTRSTRSRARRASAPAPPARAWRSSSARTG